MTDAKSGSVLGAENVDRLKEYLEALEREGRPLPMRGGEPNRSAIALACGFDRQVLYKNPAAKKLLDAAVAKLPTAAADEEEAKPETKSDRRDRRILSLRAAARGVARRERRPAREAASPGAGRGHHGHNGAQGIVTLTPRPLERPEAFDRPSEPTCDQQDRRVAAEGKGRHGPAQRALGAGCPLLERARWYAVSQIGSRRHA
jgi:hypothetical protein